MSQVMVQKRRGGYKEKDIEDGHLTAVIGQLSQTPLISST